MNVVPRVSALRFSRGVPKEPPRLVQEIEANIYFVQTDNVPDASGSVGRQVNGRDATKEFHE
jgi:hypothetical protein